MKIIPQLRFNDDKCREALEFYKGVFGDGVNFLQTMGESPMGKDYPELKDKVMHANFKVGELEFVASDMMRDKAVSGDQVSLMLNCDSEEQIRSHFEKLSQGGQVFMPLENAFWGAIFGVVTDKYGIEWNLNYPLPQK
jgi:PhnB protein